MKLLEPPVCMKNLLEELFRYLFLLADDSSDGIIRSAPSGITEATLRCLLLDPVLHYHVCDAIPTLQGQNLVKVRVLPHRSQDDNRQQKYRSTKISYAETFEQDPPAAFWDKLSTSGAVQVIDLSAEDVHQTETVGIPNVPSVTTQKLSAALNAAEPRHTFTHVRLRIQDQGGTHLELCFHKMCWFASVIDYIARELAQSPKELSLPWMVSMSVRT